MAIDSIVSLIDAEIARLQQVRSLLATTGKVTAKVTERITKKAVKAAKKTTTKVAAPVKAKKPRVLSAEARKRIADAQKKRWAAQKAEA